MMMSGLEILRRVSEKFPGTRTINAFPFLRAEVVSSDFASLDDDHREETFAKAIGISVSELRAASNRLFLRFDLLGDAAEARKAVAGGETWLGEFANDEPARPAPDRPKVVHFYGYKGGQARSSVLAFLAFTLAAESHQRVLIVDVDAEAPSLDLLLRVNVSVEGSLVGLRAGNKLVPVAVHSSPGGGSVALIGFRPSSAEFDVDATALAFEAAVSAPSHSRLASELMAQLEGKDYDVVLVDHRTGLGPTVPAWVRAMPGPVVVFDRLDGQSRRAIAEVSRLWDPRLSTPGLLVSWLSGAFIERQVAEARPEAWYWLAALARLKSRPDEEPKMPEDFADHWVVWPDDAAFRQRKFPEPHEVGGPTREAILEVRTLLGLMEVKERKLVPIRTLGPSGATDQGSFIVTEALRALAEVGSPVRFILGRKGTGKTRLLHELAVSGRGEPLLVAEDEQVGGLPAQNPALQALLKRARENDDLEGFWWTLLGAACEALGTPTERLERYVERRTPLLQGVDVRNIVRPHPPRVFLVDGLEMISQREDTKGSIQALLNVCSAIENEAVLRAHITLRVFLRTDIAFWGFENFEQQRAGKTLYLSWTTQTIFNFVLSRIVDLPWFREQFTPVVKEIEARRTEIQQGALMTDECLALLLRIFPDKLRRLNMNTSTYLRTYFSDDPSGGEGYYPRVYDAFLASIDAAKIPLVEGRVSEVAITAAHDKASVEFLSQVRQELANFTPLRGAQLDRFLRAFNGKLTPFVHKELVKELMTALSGSPRIKKAEIEETLNAMHEIGIFEDHPKTRGSWRVGRLFKSALNMKYSRGREG